LANFKYREDGARLSSETHTKMTRATRYTLQQRNFLFGKRKKTTVTKVMTTSEVATQRCCTACPVRPAAVGLAAELGWTRAAPEPPHPSCSQHPSCVLGKLPQAASWEA